MPPAGRGSRHGVALARCDRGDASGWRDAFLDGGEASLATKPTDGEERESDRLKARVGEMLLERKLLEQKIALLEGNGGPLARRRSRQ